jgi:osmoprotectant transport system permease protein
VNKTLSSHSFIKAFSLGVLFFSLEAKAAEPVQVGSKSFTESVILGEMATQLGNDAGIKTVHRSQLGGTRILWNALHSGQIDAYPEYTGTIVQELLPGTDPTGDALQKELASRGIGMTRALGFNDTYALGMLEKQADDLKIRTISDLASHPELRFGFSNEFLDRKDGWLAVRDAFHLPQKNVTGLDHDLAYRAIFAGKTDLIDLYSTDAEIAFYHLRVLEDDKAFFPQYDAVFLYRLDLESRDPSFVRSLRRLEGQVTAARMIQMNAASKLEKRSEASVAAAFLRDTLQIRTALQESTLFSTFLLRTKEHLILVATSLALSILFAVPLGVLAYARPRLGQGILALVAAIYTIPSLALLVFMIPLFGIGTLPAVVALFLYGLLPIVRNTHTGLSGISPGLRESAIVLGLSPMARLIKIELPLASPSIVAGIKTAAVINVGTATLGALIGAGGYGQPILTGIRLADNSLILLGAVPAAALALLVQSGFGVLEQIILPRGLRLKVRS